MKVMWELYSAVAKRTVLWCQTAWVSDSAPLLNHSFLYVSSTLGKLFKLFQSQGHQSMVHGLNSACCLFL